MGAASRGEQPRTRRPGLSIGLYRISLHRPSAVALATSPTCPDASLDIKVIPSLRGILCQVNASEIPVSTSMAISTPLTRNGPDRLTCGLNRLTRLFPPDQCPASDDDPVGAWGAGTRPLRSGRRESSRSSAVVHLRSYHADHGRQLQVGGREAEPGAGIRQEGRASMMLTRAVGPISMTVCSPASRRVASLRPRFAGLTALTPAARTVPAGPARQPGTLSQEGPEI